MYQCINWLDRWGASINGWCCNFREISLFTIDKDIAFFAFGQDEHLGTVSRKIESLE